MSGRLLAPAALACVLLAAAACAGGGGQRAAATPATGVPAAASGAPSPGAPGPGATATATAQPAPPAPAGQGAAATDLTFTGSMVARVRTATSAGPCGRAPAGFGAELHFTVGEQPYVLAITLLDYGGPGRYTIPPGRVSVRSGQGPGAQLLPAIRGFLTVDAGERSGQIDAAIGDGGTRVSGSWVCS